MSEVSRQRRLEKDRRRQRQRAARGGPVHGGGAPVAELVTGGITAAMSALCGGDLDGFNAHVDLLTIKLAPAGCRP
jgi:hypothetical protein